MSTKVILTQTKQFALVFVVHLLIQIIPSTKATLSLDDHEKSLFIQANRARSIYDPQIYDKKDLTNILGDPLQQSSPYNHQALSRNHQSGFSSVYHHKEQIGDQQQDDTHLDHHDYERFQELSLIETPPNGHEHEFGNSFQEKTYLSRDIIRDTCQLDRGSQRSEQLNDTFLTYCARYRLENLLSNEILMSMMHQDSKECEQILDEFIQLDELINQFDRLFKNLLTRYNCHNGYSVKWNCEDCKKAYKDWLCATNLPFYMNGERIKPCISFCERVEQRCPYLHPITKEQYGGQPVFICRDPNIPFVPEITPDIPFSEPRKCYDLCHLSDNLTELITDSLSKYHYDKCPDKSLIAEEVRSDPYYRKPGSVSIAQFNESKIQSTAQDTNDDSSSNMEQYNEELISGNVSHGQQKKLFGLSERKRMHVHNKKLDELREVLAIYKNQPKTHRFGHHAEHSSIDYSSKHIGSHLI